MFRTKAANLLAVALCLAVSVGQAEAAPRPTAALVQDGSRPVLGVALRPAPRAQTRTMPKNSYLAILLAKNAKSSIKVCRALSGSFTLSKIGLIDNEHDRFITITGDYPVNELRLCDELKGPYLKETWYDFKDIANTDENGGEGPYLMILYRDSNGKFKNCGHVDFFALKEDKYTDAIESFTDYYRDNPRNWIENSTLAERPTIAGWFGDRFSDVGDFFTGNQDRPKKCVT